VLLASDGVRFVPHSKVYYRAFHFSGLSYIGQSRKKVVAHWISMQLHIQYLRSFGDDSRIRAACLQFLRDSMVYFYPHHSDIAQDAKAMAEELGESLGEPVASWKYGWMQKTLGRDLTRKIQGIVRNVRWRAMRKLDYILFLVERRKRMPNVPVVMLVADTPTVNATGTAKINSSGEVAS
jgi:hypothetical protein